MPDRARHAGRAARPQSRPKGLPAGARSHVFRGLLRNGLLAECAELGRRQDEGGAWIVLRIAAAPACHTVSQPPEDNVPIRAADWHQRPLRQMTPSSAREATSACEKPSRSRSKRSLSSP